GLSRKSVALELLDKGVPRHDQEVRYEGRPVGFVTTGGYAPSLDKSIALAMVPADLAAEGTEIAVVIRDKEKRARVIKKPFYRKNYKK
ncbi:MAG TPA: glycine cleavage T C-terminal barrel domain-containing protein, partial [Synergistaceae bacterium]|nr:glycine cleavage T C-terminal barrel domain-containing protein [Synergistaceae bacterium]